jgi:hypothetical protein
MLKDRHSGKLSLGGSAVGRARNKGLSRFSGPGFSGGLWIGITQPISWAEATTAISVTLWRWGAPSASGHQPRRPRCNDASIGSIRPPGGWSGRDGEASTFLAAGVGDQLVGAAFSEGVQQEGLQLAATHVADVVDHQQAIAIQLQNQGWQGLLKVCPSRARRRGLITVGCAGTAPLRCLPCLRIPLPPAI